MALVDAQARWMIPHVLEKSLKKAQEDSELMENFGDKIFLLHRNISFPDPDTGQQVYALTYVLISEDASELARASAYLAGG